MSRILKVTYLLFVDALLSLSDLADTDLKGVWSRFDDVKDRLERANTRADDFAVHISFSPNLLTPQTCLTILSLELETYTPLQAVFKQLDQRLHRKNKEKAEGISYHQDGFSSSIGVCQTKDCGGRWKWLSGKQDL